MSDGAHTQRSGAEKLALAALCAAAAAVVLVPGRVQLGPVPLDAVTVSVPLAVLACLPFLRELGTARVPAFAFEVPTLAFLAIALIGVPFSTDAGSSVLTLLRYALYPALAICVGAVAVRAGNLRGLSWTLVIGALVSVIESAYQALTPFTAAAGFITAEGIRARVVAGFGNPNAFAEFLVLVIPITVALVLVERGTPRWSAALIALGEVFALAFTYSRGSLIGMTAGLVAAALIVDLRWLAGIAAALAALLAVVPRGFARLAAIVGEGGGLSDRIGLWQLALEMIRRNPVFGVGVGNYLDAVIAESLADPTLLRPGTQAFTPHNSFLTIAAETGIVGGLAFLWLGARAVRTCGVVASRLVRGSREWMLHAAFVAGVVGFTVSALTDNAFQNPRGATVFWMLAGFVAANGAAAFRDDAPEPAGRFARLWWMPRTRGRLLLDSRLGRLLIGEGRAGRGDREPWEEVRG